MAGLGDRLRAAREKKGLTIAEVAVETRIRAKIIEALEAGDNQLLPPAPFDRGLLKNYALFLDLEPDLVLDEYAIETGLKPAPIPHPEAPPPLTIQPAPPTPFESPPIFISPAEPTRSQPPDQREPYPWRQNVISSGAPPSNLQGKAEGAGAASVTPEKKAVSTFDKSLGTREAAPFFEARSEPVFEVATEGSAEPLPAPDQPFWTQRIGATKLPEAIAAVAVAVAILGLAVFGYNRFFVSDNRAPQVVSAESPQPETSLPQQTTIPLPTSVPTFEATLPGGVEVMPSPTKAKPRGGTAIPINPASGQMQVQISAGTTPVWAWVVADNVEVYKGNIQNDTKTWNARERLYIQVKDLPNGSVSFNGKAILARVFAERKVIERAWQMNAAGTAVAVEPQAFVPTVAPAATPAPATTPTNPTGLNLTSAPTPPPISTGTPMAALLPFAESMDAAALVAGASLGEPGLKC